MSFLKLTSRLRESRKKSMSLTKRGGSFRAELAVDAALQQNPRKKKKKNTEEAPEKPRHEKKGRKTGRSKCGDIAEQWGNGGVWG